MFFLQRMFTKSNRLVYSWASKHSSPVSSHIKETLNGLATVRAFRVQDRFVANLEAAVEKHTKFLFTARCMSEWFYMRIMLLSESVALAGGLIILWDRSISPSMAWLVLTSSTGVSLSLLLLCIDGLQFVPVQFAPAQPNTDFETRRS